ncbi:MarR family winged helix-turn-helix transcriptional regulator [Granulosicoccus sp. 3-233]|uniref:MarR family winged helix-turn-helix transcriptional regulator n=1 Tax=Granulosicoccus sp. 3-233 TaxID=3417969 RepID=UPI003D32B572
MNNEQNAPHTEPTVTQLLDTAARIERRLDRMLSCTRGVSYSEYRLLTTLAEASSEGLPRVVLAEAVGLSASAVTRALKPLEKIGCLITEKGERDARQSRAIITPVGLELLSDAKGIMRDALRELPLNSLSSQQVADFRNRLEELR